jgi:hypothetical protein
MFFGVAKAHTKPNLALTNDVVMKAYSLVRSQNGIILAFYFNKKNKPRTATLAGSTPCHIRFIKES